MRGKSVFRLMGTVVLTMLLFTGMSGCSEKESGPGSIMDIDGISVPAQFRGYYGDEVTVGGAGFDESDIIAMQSSASSSEEYTAQVVRVTDNSVSFLIPEGLPSGEYKLYVIRNEARRLLGRMTVYITSGITVPDKDGYNIKGFVGYNGTPVPGVAVSDGFRVTVTDEDGFYWLSSGKENGYVFISVPSGYEVEVSRTIPQFFTYLKESAEVTEQCDFNLYPRDNTRHRIIVFTDTHLVDRVSDRSQFQSGFMMEMRNYLSRCKAENVPVYCIALGDLSWDSYWESNNYNLANYLDDIQALDCAVFSAPGNHDNDPEVSGNDFLAAGPFRQTIGPTDYSFNIGDIHYIMLDNVIYTNPQGAAGSSHSYEVGITEEKMSWLKADLALVGKSTPIVLGMHVPLYKAPAADGSTSYNFTGAEELVSVLSGYDVHVISGHTHYNFSITRDKGIREHNIAAVCATWWWTGHTNYAGNHICRDGSDGGYKIFDMDGGHIGWRYKGIGRDDDYQFRTYDRNSIRLQKTSECPSASQTDFEKYAHGYDKESNENIVLINVFDWADDWDIKVVEEGGKELPVTRVRTYDPLHVISYNMLKLAKNSQMTFPTSNISHIFQVQASSPTSTLTVTVKDEEGNEYVQEMERPKALTYQMQ
ncbi:MAG: calcineurin-like phosphoesterase C-terminal domain-containing protein [Bacteroidetes bacterium]|uniref:Calcineurin-like phosphoesterase C-terminal domain-containing protein n=1 Tax=Candidatus Cryptobacteroides avicola TaxID=2840757 RepID=A0A940III1_9BACT|nr:calcineurin-like phosphoesterase C-terminal domain-containing protein [Candidatus Cryptobacteroides avicola]